MPEIWSRNIPSTWANQDGWRTDIAKTTLRDYSVKKAKFVLASGEEIFVDMDELRDALKTAPIRDNGMVGPFNVNPHSSTINGFKVNLEIIKR